MGEVKRYTRAEVSACNGRAGAPLWIIVRDSVYDVTGYIYEHPAGADTLHEAAGRDATRDFDDVGHSSDAKIIKEKYKIGELIEEEKHYDAAGKKKKKVVDVPLEGPPGGCLRVVTCGLLG